MTYPNTYHSVIYVGPTLAEARNFAEFDWLVEPLFMGCSKKRGCGSGPHMTVAAMKTGDHHRLEVAEFEKSDGLVSEKRAFKDRRRRPDGARIRFRRSTNKLRKPRKAIPNTGIETSEDEKVSDEAADEAADEIERQHMVKEIQWWIEFGIAHSKQIVLPEDSQPISSEQLKKSLTAFDPTGESLEETWLNDIIVFSLVPALPRTHEKINVMCVPALRDAL